MEMENTTAEELRWQSLEIQIQKINMNLISLKDFFLKKSLEQEIPPFCDLKKACELKGTLNFKSLYKRWWQQPCCGTQFKRLNGNKVWTREQIITWLEVSDDTLESYAAEMGVDISRHFENGKALPGE